LEIRQGSRVITDYSARHKTYNKSAKGQARNERTRDTRLAQSIERYLTKEFVAWDGEGGNELDGSHTYFLLGNSDGSAISERNGLGTIRVFEAFLSGRSGVTNIVYGGNYDINMIIKDLPYEALQRLYKLGRVRWNGYHIEWRPGKSFTIKQGNKTFTLFDILPFFQCSFVKACDEYLGDNWPYRDEIIREKSRRGNFEWSEIDTIGDYNRAELANTVSLADELRARLFKVDIRVTRWDGPGAIAAALYKKYQTKSHIGSPPKPVVLAGRHAYAGGRFEIIRKGHSLSGAYQYDIRSAYPSAIRSLPCNNPDHGQWSYRTFTERPIRNVKPFGLYRIEVVTPHTESVTQPQPLWMRNKNGTVYFAEYSHGWYWSPEAQLALELGGVNIYEAWEWEQECECNPFHFVEALYNKRAALKKAGDGAHVGLKLGLNSLYGKLAQQIGYDPGPPLRLPPYHSLEWAGYITSHCRAQMYRAAMLSLDDIIAFETDAIFSRVPLDLPIGGRLGEFDETKYSSLTYLKSGFYYGTLADGTSVEKSRGLNKGSITREQVIEALNNRDIETLSATQTRFIGLGQAMHQDMNKWRTWITAPREIQIMLNGKRIDLLDSADTWKDINDGWQETQEGYTDTTFSYRYPVAWATDDDQASSVEGLGIDELRTEQAHEVYEP
jgi:hypothetical protein